MLELSLRIGARALGYLAEIEAGRWVYKGESFRYIPVYERKLYSDKYLRMIALFQSAICASKNKVRCVDILIDNFCTDNWFQVYFDSFSFPGRPKINAFESI